MSDQLKADDGIPLAKPVAAQPGCSRTGAERQFAGGRVFPLVDVLSSRVKLRIRALHEGDVMGFVEGLAASRQGFFPLDRCALKRLEATSPDALQPRVEAECAFEWITLKEKNAARPG